MTSEVERPARIYNPEGHARFLLSKNQLLDMMHLETQTLFPFAPDTLLSDEETLSFSFAVFTAKCSLMPLQESTWVVLEIRRSWNDHEKSHNPYFTVAPRNICFLIHWRGRASVSDCWRILWWRVEEALSPCMLSLFNGNLCSLQP